MDKKKNSSFRWSNVSLACILEMLFHNLWMLLCAALIFAMGTSLFFDFFHDDIYRASMTYAVTARESSKTSNTNIKAGSEVAAVFEELLETNVITQSIRNHSPALKGFSGKIVASQVAESNLITVYIEDTSAETAFLALDALKELFPDFSDYVSKNTVIQVIQNPSVATSPANKINENFYIIVAALAGACLMAAFLCWYDIRRETVQTSSGARHLLDAPIIATIGHERKYRTLRSYLRRDTKETQVFSPTTSYGYTEEINNICARLEHENASHGRKVFMVTGVGENEGKSTVAGNIAAMLAMKGKSVAIIDCDMRKPALNKFFGKVYTAALPLNKMLSEPFSRQTFLSCLQRHPKMKMYMMFPDKGDEDAAKLLTSSAMRHTIKQTKAFDFVIIDTPPMGYFTDAEALADMVDATMLVVRQDRTPAADINDASDTLRNSRSEFLGCILNDMIGPSGGGYGYGYGYGYGKRYGYGYGGYGYGYGHSHEKKKHSGKGGDK